MNPIPRQVPFREHRKEPKNAMGGLLVGDTIGEGAHRRVFALPYSPDLVLKVEKFEGEFLNVAEWRTWDYAQWDPRAKRWLAPCVEISNCGLALLQRRCPDLTDGQWEALREVPAWLSDTKRENWGWLEDAELGARPVMRDYALTRMTQICFSSRRMVEKCVN